METDQLNDELRHIFDFTDADLKANAKGVLTEHQKHTWTCFVSRVECILNQSLRLRIFVALGVLGYCYLILYANAYFVKIYPQLWFMLPLGWLIVLLIIIVGAFYGYYRSQYRNIRYDIKKGQAMSISGFPQFLDPQTIRGQTFYQVQVNKVVFRVTQAQFGVFYDIAEAFEETPFLVYYLPVSGWIIAAVLANE